LASQPPLAHHAISTSLLGAAVAMLTFGIQVVQAGTGGEPRPAGVVSGTPSTNLPHLPASTTLTEQIRQLAQCGGTMYAVGSFTLIRKGSTTYTRNNIFSFKATSPFTVTTWAPDVVGTYGTTSNPSDILNAIAFAAATAQSPTSAATSPPSTAPR
jgi:hypothetical protein